MDYAMEAVKQGSISIGLRSGTHAVVVGLKRSPHAMAGYQEKVFKLDEHVGLSMSGLIVDGRLIAKLLRNDCLTYKTIYNSEHPVGRLVTKLAKSIVVLC
jgi:20S proteasome subunit alpha 6